MKKLILAIFLPVLTLIGLGAMLMSIVWSMLSLRLLGETYRTTGTVVGQVEGPLVQFTTEDGRQFKFEVLCAPLDCFMDNTVGSKVPVIYQRNFPELAIADVLMSRFVTPLFFFLIGLVISIPGIVYASDIIEWIRERYYQRKQQR